MAKCSLAEQDFAASAHVLTGLGGSLVGTGLQTDHGLAGLQDLLGEVTLALISGLGAKVGTVPLGMSVSLTAEGVQCADDLGNVLLLPKVDCLEHVDVRDSICFDCGLEVGNVLHHLELSTRGVDLVDGARLQLVDELAEDCAVLEDIFERVARGELGTEDGLDPLLDLLLLVRVALGSELGANLAFQRHVVWFALAV